MTDRKELARRLVMEKSILDVLRDANAETRDEARAAYESGDADAANTNGTLLGRVRRDKPTVGWRVTNWGAFEQWVRAHVPHAWIAIPQVDPGFRAAVLKTGQYIDPDGVVHDVPGVEQEEAEGRLVVTTTDAAEQWARGIVGRSMRGELE